MAQVTVSNISEMRRYSAAGELESFFYIIEVTSRLSEFSFRLVEKPCFKKGDEIEFNPDWFNEYPVDLFMEFLLEIEQLGALVECEHSRLLLFVPSADIDPIRVCYISEIVLRLYRSNVLENFYVDFELPEMADDTEPSDAFILGALITEYFWKYRHEQSILAFREREQNLRRWSKNGVKGLKRKGGKSKNAVRRSAKAALARDQTLGRNVSALARAMLDSELPPCKGNNPVHGVLSQKRIEALLRELNKEEELLKSS